MGVAPASGRTDVFDYHVASGRGGHGSGFTLARVEPANRAATQVPAIFMRSINTEPIVLLPIV